jgi:mannose/fructose/N-acetylgalactosamine-specific phosphotransferase system component IID
MSTTPIPPAPTAVAVSKKSKPKDNIDHDDSKKIKLALLGPERGFYLF